MNKPKVPAKFAKYISDSPKCAIVTLDRPLVDWLLEINTHNRNAMPAVVNRYATEIARGEWRVTSQGLGISRDGVLIDGQHRLLALRKCGYPPTRAVIAWGLDEDAQIKIDTHAKRSVSNILSLALGCKMNNKQTAGFRILATIDAGKPFDTEYGASRSVSDLVKTYEKYLDPWSSIQFHQYEGFNGPLFAVCTLAVANGVPADVVQEFVDRLYDGAGLPAGNPILTLRNFYSRKGRYTAGSNGAQRWFSAVARALCAFVLGEKLEKIYTPSPADAVEAIKDLGRSEDAVAG